MKTYLTEQLKENGASLTESENGYAVKFASGQGLNIVIPRSPDPLDITDVKQMPVASFLGASTIVEIAKYDKAELAISNDKRLSSFGSQERLLPLRNGLIRAVTYSLAELDRFQAGLAQQELQRYAPPPADPTNIRQAISDDRVWGWYSRLSPKELGSLYSEINTGSNEYIIHSILRDPVKIGLLPELARNGWKAIIDRNDAEGRATLDAAHQLAEWGERTLAIAKAHTFVKRVTIDRESLYWLTEDLNGEKHFGFSPSDVLQFKRRATLKEKGVLA